MPDLLQLRFTQLATSSVWSTGDGGGGDCYLLPPLIGTHGRSGSENNGVTLSNVALCHSTEARRGSLVTARC